MSGNVALIFGANGISGLALISQLILKSPTEWRKIIAVSRRPPVLSHADPHNRVQHASLDLTSSPATIAEGLKKAGAEEATHVYFYAYIAKEKEEELVDINKTLFGNSVEAVAEVAKGLKVFHLQTGYKYYGVHKGGEYLAPYPFREDSPRHKGLNFYYVQEDMLKDAAKKYNWAWLVTRPNFILGVSKGNFMSFAVTVALYATACQSLAQPLYFPGSSVSYALPYDQSTAKHNAEFQIHASLKPEAHNRAFNIFDSAKKTTFNELWPKIADYFDLQLPVPLFAKPPPEEKSMGSVWFAEHSASEWAKGKEDVFQKIVKAHNLDPNAFSYATWDFLDFGTTRTWADDAALDSARSIGWGPERDIDPFENGYKKVFDELKALNIIPKTPAAPPTA